MRKLIDALYYLVVAGIIGGFIIQLTLQLTPTLERTFGMAVARVPQTWALPLGIIGLLLLNLLLERILPLRALSETRWVYIARPARRMPGFDGQSWVQLGLVGGVAALVGVGQGMWWQYAVIAVLSRFVMGMRNWTLAQLLAAGTTRLVGLGGVAVQDSELVSQSLAQCAIAHNPKVWVSRKPVGNPWLLVARRIGRRFYLPLVAVTIGCLSLSMAPAWPQCAVVVLVVGWSIVGAGIARCARFGVWGAPETRWVLVTVVAVHALVAAGIVCAAWQVTHAGAAIIATVVTVAYVSVVRSRPRAATSMDLVDSGLGALISPSLIGYYTKGLLVAGVGVVCVLKAISGN